jgi:hypothetical protein
MDAFFFGNLSCFSIGKNYIWALDSVGSGSERIGFVEP